jgi:hypothetical protein
LWANLVTAQTLRLDSDGPSAAYVEIDTTRHRVAGFGMAQPARSLLGALVAFVDYGQGLTEIDSSDFSTGLPTVGPLSAVPPLSLFLPGPTNFWYSNVITLRGTQELVISYGVRVDDPPLTSDGERLSSGADVVFTVQVNNNSDGWIRGLRFLRYARAADAFDVIQYLAGKDGVDFTEDDVVRYENTDNSFFLSVAGPGVVGRQLDADADGSLLAQIRSGSPLNGGIVGPLSNATAENAWENGPFSIPPRGALIFGLPINAATASFYVTAAEQGMDLTFGETYVRANFSSTGTDGQITTIHYRQIPWNASFGRKLTKSALGKSAAQDSPINVPHHWIVGINKQNYAADLTFTYDPSADGIADENALLLMTRASASDDWVEYADYTRLPDSDQIRANNVTSSAEWALLDMTTLPVELAAFTTQQVQDGVLLEWQTASETNNLGFHVYRAPADGDGSPQDSGFVRVTSTMIPGAGTTDVPQIYSYLDRSVTPGGRYWYVLEQVDTDGTTERSAPVLATFEPPKRFSLLQNYPNPFNPSTTIEFDLAEDSKVQLSVIDIRGREVAILAEGPRTAGRHAVTWEARDQDGLPLPSGVYLLRLRAVEQQLLRRMVLLR